jgi:hypothetical protein
MMTSRLTTAIATSALLLVLNIIMVLNGAFSFQ